MTWLLIIASTILFSVADTLSAMWARTQSNAMSVFYLCAVAFFGTGAYLYFGLATKNIGVANGSAAINAMVAVLTVSIGIMFFKDPMSARQYAGVAFALIGIFLICVK